MKKSRDFLIKIWLYTINFLQIAALNNKGENTYAVLENNGYYMAKFQDDKMTSSIKYVKSKDTNGTIINEKIDYQKLIIYPYLEKSDCFNANPLYIKTIEVQSDKRS